jgi:hypothetical protein
VTPADWSAEREEQRAWIDGLAAKYGVVRLEAALTPAQLEAQQDRVLRALGLRFHTTEPYARHTGQVSLKCSLYGDRPHTPCSGTTDDGLELPCLHWCHAPKGPHNGRR